MEFNYYLRLDGIKGESKATGHSGEIELLSYSMEQGNIAIHSGSGSATKQSVHIHTMHITKKMDLTTVKLMEYSASGKRIPTGKITIEKVLKDGSTKPFVIIDLEDITIPSYQPDQGVMQDGLPIGAFTIDFAKIKWAVKS
ncbi:MAG: type VI secretion system tube protein Hcp [Acidobacteriota bacterium]|nr:type VI secretion system tube protein Hcp [Acidobacteriota bacterium]